MSPLRDSPVKVGLGRGEAVVSDNPSGARREIESTSVVSLLLASPVEIVIGTTNEFSKRLIFA